MKKAEKRALLKESFNLWPCDRCKGLPASPDADMRCMGCGMGFRQRVQQMTSTLWCIRVGGPDNLIAQPSREIAEHRAAEWTEAWQKLPHDADDPEVTFVVEPWLGSAETHAKELKAHAGMPPEI